MPAVRLAEPGGGRELATLRWGLVPGWAKDLSIGSRLINARSETVAEKPAFLHAFRRRRCLLPASGFFEWRRAGERKLPTYLAAAAGGVLALAGIWERWLGQDGAPVESCAILTTAANVLVSPIHDRMPVIVAAAAHAAWLDPGTSLERVQSLFVPAPADLLAAVAVSTAVNDPRHDAPDCVRPLPG